MPSSKALTNVTTGAGKLHSNVASAAADYQTSSGTESLLASMIAALNQEISNPTSTNVSLSAGDTSTTLDASIYGGVWMGLPSESVKDLFDIVNVTGDTRISGQVDKSPIVVSGVTGASVGSNTFTTNLLTINFSTAIPSTGSYKLLFSSKRTIGSFLKGALATTRRFVPEPSALETQFFELKWDNTSVGNWDDLPLTTLQSAALSGLNERYSRSSTATGNLDTAGDGGLVARSGQAVTVQATANEHNYSSPQPDPYLAQYMVTAGPLVSANSLGANRDGGTGYVGVLQQRVTDNTNHYTLSTATTLASRLDVITRSTAVSTLGGGSVVKTRVSTFNDATAALNPDGGSGADDIRTIRLKVGDYFWENTTGNFLSEVALGRDMIEVALPTGELQVYVITTLFGGPHPSSAFPSGSPGSEDQRRALVRTIAGDSPEFPSGASTTGVRFRFIKTARFQGVGTAAYKALFGAPAQADPILLNYEYHAVTPPLTDDPRPSGSNEIDPGVPEFYARSRTRRSLISTESPHALAWGGFNAREHVQETRGHLRGDGAVECTLINKQMVTQDYGSAGSALYTWHPTIDGSTLFITTSHVSSGVYLTLALNTDYISWAAKEGDEITIITMDTNSSGQQLVMTWPASFIFSGVEGDMPSYPESGPTFSKYHGVYLGSSFGWLMTVTNYLGPGA